MLDKLVNILVSATQSKTTKRGVEWVMADFIYCIYLLIMLVGMVAFISTSAWYALICVALSFMLVLYGWGWFSFQLRKTLLNILYASTEHIDENGDDEEDTIDKLNGLMRQLANQMDDMKNM